MRRTHGTCQLPKWREPRAQVVRDRHEPPLRRLAFRRSDLDKTSLEINLSPVKPRNLFPPQAGKKPNRNGWQYRLRTSQEKATGLASCQDTDNRGRHLYFYRVRYRVVRRVAARNTKRE